MISQEQLAKRTFWIFSIAWMIIIFGFSDQSALVSDTMSGGLVEMAEGLIRGIFSFLTGNAYVPKLNWLTFLIRKTAHAFLYMVLGILISKAMVPDNRFTTKAILIVLLICMLYGISDEVHQLFLIGRSCEIRDIVIDGCGAYFGMLLRIFFKRFKQKRHTDDG